jgi:hypothetical protein
MADVHEVTIAEVEAPGGEISGYTLRARVEVGGEDGVYEFSSEDREIASVVDPLIATVRKAAIKQARERLQRILDAEEAFER